MPPRGPFTSFTRMLTRSMELANFPNFIPNFCRIDARCSLLRSAPNIRIWAGTIGTSVRLDFRLSVLGIQPGKGERVELRPGRVRELFTRRPPELRVPSISTSLIRSAPDDETQPIAR